MSVNRVTLIGNLGKDPELRYTASGVAVANFSIATSEKWKDSDGQQQEKTEWHNIVVWRQLAEICSKYLAKGSQVYLEGKISTSTYDDRDGKKCYKTEVVADQMRMLGSRPKGSAPREDRSESGHNHRAHDSTTTSQSIPNQEPPFDPDEEIPF